jgi:hypothetical protein
MTPAPFPLRVLYARMALTGLMGQAAFNHVRTLLGYLGPDVLARPRGSFRRNGRRG